MEQIHLFHRPGLNLETAGLLMAFSHLMVLVVIILWFSLDKPTSFALFRARLWAALCRRPLPRVLPAESLSPRAGTGLH